MNEPRHNTHLIVTVFSACVALMCGVPAAQGATVKTDSAQFPANYIDIQSRRGEFRPAAISTPNGKPIAGRSIGLIRLGNFKPASFLHFFDLAAVLPGFGLLAAPASYPLDLHPVGENTRPLAQPIYLRIVTRLPRAGLV